MPRRPRTLAPGLGHHIVHRGICKQVIFEDDHDRWKFLELLAKNCRRHGVSVYAFCLMDNHYHLYAYDHRGTLSQLQHVMGSNYTAYFNGRHQRDGALLRGRFFSKPVFEERYALSLLRYIHLNPVKAGIVRTPSQYFWSSFAGYTAQRWDQLLCTEPLLTLLANMEVSPSALETWTLNPESDYTLDPKAERAIAAILLDGNEAAKSRKLAADSALHETRKRARNRIVDGVAAAYHLPPEALLAPPLGRFDPTADARAVAMLRCQTQEGFTLEDLAHAFGVKKTSVGNHLRRGRLLRHNSDGVRHHLE